MIRLNLRPREKGLAIGIAVLSMIALSRIWILEPLRAKSENLDREISLYQRQLQKAHEKIQEEDLWKTKNKDFWKSLKFSGTEDEGMSVLLAHLQQLAGQSNLKVMEMKPLGMKNQDYLNRMSVSLNLEGDLGAIMIFLHGIESNSQGLMVQELLLEPLPTQGQILRCQIQVVRLTISEIPNS